MLTRVAPLLLAVSSLAFSAGTPGRPSLAEPSLAPDRPEIAFVSGGDIWTAPLAGGEARLLVSHPANDTRPLFSPDGKRLAFQSNRTGGDEIFVLDLASGDIRRITYDNGANRLDAWSRDGRWLYFSSASRDIAGMNDIYRVSPEGGTPMQVAADRFASEYWAAPSPGGDTLAITATGVTAAQWWRRGHSHIDESKIWLVRPAPAGAPLYEPLVTGDGKNAWPIWSADGKRIFFVSDRSGAENLWVKEAGSKSPPRQLTTFKDGRFLWPSASADAKTIVFERDFAVWRLDTANGNASPVPITLRGAPAGPGVTHVNATGQFRDLVLSPDGKKVAFVSHGEIFAAAAKEGGAAARLSSSSANEFDPVWSGDSRRVLYASDRDGSYRLYLYDFATNAETRLTEVEHREVAPEWSPDGKSIAYVRDGRELVVLDAATRAARTVATGWFGLPPSRRAIEWSHDSQWLAYGSVGPRGFHSVFVVAAAGGTPRQVSFVPNANIGAIQWSPDGTYLLVQTGQRTEPGMIVRIDLIPKTPKFREDQFRALFEQQQQPQAPKPAAEAAKPPAGPAPKKPAEVKIDFDGIRLRARPMNVALDPSGIRISPDGKTLLFSSAAGGQQNLYTYSLDELAKEPPVARQLTATPGMKSNAQWSPDGKEIFYLEGGRLQVINVENRQAKAVALSAELDVSFAEEKMEMFQQAWTYLHDGFYDPEFHGVDWKAVRTRWEPHIAGARTHDEVRRLISLMLGELNASHLGISTAPGAQGGGPPSATGRLGVRFDRAEYESNGRLRFSEIVALSPAAVAGIRPGEYLLAVDGTRADRNVNVDRLLEHKVDKRVALTIGGSANDAGREVVLRPISNAAEKQLLYRQWVESRRDYVHRISGGKLGYVHMPDMSADSLTQLYLDLDTENQVRDGVVIDLRNNNGGFVNAYALDVLSRRPYLQMTPRGLDHAAPARSMLGQRSLERPTVLVVNQHSLSDAEDFTEGYRAMKLGKVVGEPTAGWIIYTGAVQLIDGSMLRLPGVRITTNEGVNMERNPRPVDVRVDRPLGEWYAGRDTQLDAAVRELLKEIGRGSAGVAATAGQ